MNHVHDHRVVRRAATAIEVLVLIAVGLVLLAVTAPLLAAVSCDARRERSKANLAVIAAAHASYAADWGDRQFTLAADDLGAANGSCAAYAAQHGCHPPVVLGADCDGVAQGFFFGCGQGGCSSSFDFALPMSFTSKTGSFRLVNAAGFHAYVNSRFYDPVFYAPADEATFAAAAPAFDERCGYVALPGGPVLSSYAASPAAMWNPQVLSKNPTTLKYFKNPNTFADGYASPTVGQCAYPDLKTRTIEHHWMYNVPGPCNPSFAGCQPYLFNHGIESRPETLFFDGSVRTTGPYGAQIAEVRSQYLGGPRLWSRDTPLGSSGYFMFQANDFIVESSYHILTIDGILGRDLLSAGR